MNVAYLWIWYEFENANKRPDGFALHASPEEAEKYVQAYEAKHRRSGPVPAEYDAPSMNGCFLVEVDDAIADQLKVSPTIRVFEHEKQYRLDTSRTPRPHLVTYVPASSAAAA